MLSDPPFILNAAIIERKETDKKRILLCTEVFEVKKLFFIFSLGKENNLNLFIFLFFFSIKFDLASFFYQKKKNMESVVELKKKLNYYGIKYFGFSNVFSDPPPSVDLSC